MNNDLNLEKIMVQYEKMKYMNMKYNMKCNVKYIYNIYLFI